MLYYVRNSLTRNEPIIIITIIIIIELTITLTR